MVKALKDILFGKKLLNRHFAPLHSVACFWLLAISLFLVSKSHAQQDSLELETPQIVVMARPQQNGSIMLRWAVTTALAWRKLNQDGYEVKRYTVTQNQTTLPRPIEKSLGFFKPQPLEEWMPQIETNDNAAVLAQSIYGESFDVEGMNELSSIINLAQEQEQRFTWGLYAADQDFEVAQMAGLGYVDNEVYANEKYVYKVSPAAPDNVLSIQEGGVFIGLKDYEELPKPLDLAVVFMDGKTLLSWNYATHHQLYNSYYVERSEDGINFKSLNDLPLTSLNHSERTDPQRMFYTDSITNGKTYHYRIKAKTPFGEFSPFSEVVSGKGEKLLEYVPHITNKHYLDERSVLLEWEFLEEGNGHITGFELNKSNRADGTYKTVVKNIPPEARKVQYDGLDPTNYMTITAIGKNGGSRTSFPALVQPVDSVPPNKPKGFKGSIDSLGVVTLNWDPNTEKDILGYRIFKGNNKNEEYSQITVSPHQGTTYYDSVSVKSLNNKVYYQLIAVDQRFNMSEPSEILEIKKPDFVRPNQPVFKSYHIKEGKVHLTWAKSSSEDVVQHQLYRKEKDSVGWRLVHTLEESSGPSIASWADSEVEENRQYSYTLIAVDDSGLESDPSPPLTVVLPKATLYPPLEGVYGLADREHNAIELHWKSYKLENASKIVIYKGLKAGSMNLLKEIPADATGIIDRKVKVNNEYTYLFRMVFQDGGVSGISTLDVKY